MALKFKRMALSVIVAAGVAVSAQAATVNVSTQGANAFLDSKNMNGWYQSASIALNGVARSVWAGAFRLKETTAGGAVTNFIGFCLEPLDTLRLPKAYDESTPLSYTAVARLGALVDNAMSLVRDGKSAAAFQLAAWEIANEGRGALNLTSGAFRAAAGQSATQQLAQSWLDLIGAGSWALDQKVMILSAAGTQDLVTDLTPAPIPVPAAGVLLMGGLGGLAALRRRRRA